MARLNGEADSGREPEIIDYHLSVNRLGGFFEHFL
jgi:hypothetical protein